MLFKTKEALDNYLADKTREIEERLEYELIDEKGIMVFSYLFVGLLIHV